MGKFNKTRKEYLEEVIEETEFPTNKFVYIADVSSPYGTILIYPVYSEDKVEKIKEEMLQKVKGIRLRFSIITNVLIGSIGTRKFDMQQSKQYELLQKLVSQ
jgi:hypothetical protein